MAFSFSAIGDYVGSLVHPSVADDVAFARHRAFILSHLAGGVFAFAAVPLILFARGGHPSAAEIVVMVWLVAPILAALDLSRTGQIERAHFISSASLAMLILAVAAITGGMNSFALVWLPVVVFEAAFSQSRRVILASLGTIAFVVLVLLGLKIADIAPVFTTPRMLPEVAALMAVIYAAALALRWDSLQRTLAQSRSSQEAHYQLLAEHMTDVVTRHTPTGAVSFASPAAARLFGSGAELHGRGLFERVHVADRPAYLTALSRGAQGQANCAEIRVRKTVPEAAYGAPPEFIRVQLACKPGGTDGVTAVMRELVEHAQEERAADNTMRDEPNVVDTAKGRFLASMSHELRTPLNAIIGFSELLASEQFSDERRRHEYAGLIHESGLHLLSVVNGILDMSRIDSGNFAIVAEPFALKPVVESCFQMFSLKAASASITLKSEVREDLVDTLADKRAFKQILINLLSNAIKFTQPGGSVTVSAREESGMVRVDVVDTGLGIAPDDIPHLGTSFFQARSNYDRPYEGTGLGLSVVKGLIDLHGGSFSVTSEVGKGTRVSVCLPAHMQKSEEIARTGETLFTPDMQRQSAMG